MSGKLSINSGRRVFRHVRPGDGVTFVTGGYYDEARLYFDRNDMEHEHEYCYTALPVCRASIIEAILHEWMEVPGYE
jgi:hypothetical protein